MSTRSEAPAAERASRVPVAASSARGSASRSAFAPAGRNMNSCGCLPTVNRERRHDPEGVAPSHGQQFVRPLQGRGKFSLTRSVGWHPRLFTLNPSGIHRPAVRSGARASARFTAQIPVASKTNSIVTNIPALKRRERRAPQTPEASNMNSRGCKPTVNRNNAARTQRGRTIPRATICSTLSGSRKISGSCSVGLHPRLFTLNPVGILGLRRQSAAATALSHARRSHEFAKTIAPRKAGSRFACPRTPRRARFTTRFTHLTL
jgi:hypothetical protein